MPLTRLQLPPLPEVPAHVRKRASVAMVVGPGDELLFIRRATREGDPWSGDMAFPGGRAEPEDPDLAATAERETWEEIGLDLTRGHRLGALPVHVSPVRDPDGTFGIFPFVYRVPAWGDFRLSEEVAEVHRFGLDRLFSGEGRGEFRLQRHGWDAMLPCLRLDGTFIWGLSLRMLDELREQVTGEPPPPRFRPVGGGT